MIYTKDKLEKLKDELTDKIENNTADDIINSPFNFNEYAPFVVISYLRNVSRDEIPAYTLIQIKHELSYYKDDVSPSLYSKIISKIFKRKINA